jgi:vacuolar-type H+-ATPase subunit I/STV1
LLEPGISFGLEKRQTAERRNLMSARTAAATVERSLPVESNIEAGISSLIEQQTPKRIQVEKQPPKRIQIEDDAERCRSFVARITSNSIDELGELASELTSALQNLQEYLKAEGERVQREIVDYAHLNHTALSAIKTIIETTRAPSNEKVEERS